MIIYLSENIMTSLLLALLILSIAFIVVPIIVVLINKKYKKFVSEHSIALKQLNEINSRYQFKEIDNKVIVDSYDNENYYNNISCEDYLIYYVVDNQERIKSLLKDSLSNKALFDKYEKEIGKCLKNQYDTTQTLKNTILLSKTENIIFNSQIKKPNTSFSIRVVLKLVTINGNRLGKKIDDFSPQIINDIIYKINQKRGSFYLSKNIWDAICHVERGKVTNKLRFEVYDRDRQRCCQCGKKSNKLEIDHIIPIAKGGKSTLDNLQTLCHECNIKKGMSIK